MFGIPLHVILLFIAFVLLAYIALYNMTENSKLKNKLGELKKSSDRDRDTHKANIDAMKKHNKELVEFDKRKRFYD